MNAWYNGYADPATMIKDGYQLISIPDGLVISFRKPATIMITSTNHTYIRSGHPHISAKLYSKKSTLLFSVACLPSGTTMSGGISVKDIHHRIFSPLQTLSVKMWTGAQTGIPYETFNEKRALLSEAPGVNQLARIGKSRNWYTNVPQSLPAALPIIRWL